MLCKPKLQPGLSTHILLLASFICASYVCEPAHAVPVSVPAEFSEPAAFSLQKRLSKSSSPGVIKVDTAGGPGVPFVRRATRNTSPIIEHGSSVADLSPNILRSEAQLANNIHNLKTLHPIAFRAASIIMLLAIVFASYLCTTAKFHRVKSSKQGQHFAPGFMRGKGKGWIGPTAADSNQVVWGTIPRNAGGAYPWHSMPAQEALLAVGPSFHSNLHNVLPQCLSKRGLRRADKGKVALVAMWNWPGERQRALVELCLKDTLANKRALAEHLAKNGLMGMAPPTFSSAAVLRRALTQRHPVTRKPRLIPEVCNGLWFLKHTCKDNNTGVSCYKGVEALLAQWEDPDFGDDPSRYIAQAEVRQPLLLRGVTGDMHKVTVRAYVLVLRNKRCFLHRELLLKSHPYAYDSADPDLMRHVLCHVKYEGVASSKGSEWEHYDVVWNRIGQMMIDCFGAFDAQSVLEDEDLDSTRQPTLAHRFESVGVGIRKFFRDVGLGNLVRRRQGTEEAQTMKYALLGVDVIVDENLCPWLLEFNRSPTLAPEPKDPLGTRIKADVIEDFCQLTVDPILQAAASASKNIRPAGASARGKGQGKGALQAPPPEAMPPSRFAPEIFKSTGESSEAKNVSRVPPVQEGQVQQGKLQWAGLHDWDAKMAAGEVDGHVALPNIMPDVASGARGFVEVKQRMQMEAVKGK